MSYVLIDVLTHSRYSTSTLVMDWPRFVVLSVINKGHIVDGG